jgi:iron(II)-dependent oxidoreductase
VQTLTPIAIDRAALAAWYRANRRRSSDIFGIVDPDVFYDAPIPLRHPFVFYEGHFPAFSFLTLVRDALGEASVDRGLEDLFNRGIDPDSLDAARGHQRADWPTRSDVAAFAAACDARVLAALAVAPINDPENPRLQRGLAAYTILEHEEMHHETLLYIVHRLPPERKRIARVEYRDVAAAERAPVAIPAGRVTLGVDLDAVPFAWDNESPQRSVDVGAFGCDVYDVTNGEYAAFVRAGGPVPPFWVELGDGEWGLRCFAETIPLPASWPVYCTNAGPARGCSPKQNMGARRTARPRATSDVNRGAATLQIPDTATSTSNASIPNPWVHIPPARAPGAFTISLATVGNGPRRRSRHSPASNPCPPTRSTQPTSSTVSTS